MLYIKNTFTINFDFFVVPYNIFVNIIILDLQFFLYLTTALIDPDKKWMKCLSGLHHNYTEVEKEPLHNYPKDNNY